VTRTHLWDFRRKEDSETPCWVGGYMGNSRDFLGSEAGCYSLALLFAPTHQLTADWASVI
jgi:hypothetical protein